MRLNDSEPQHDLAESRGTQQGGAKLAESVDQPHNALEFVVRVTEEAVGIAKDGLAEVGHAAVAVNRWAVFQQLALLVAISRCRIDPIRPESFNRDGYGEGFGANTRPARPGRAIIPHQPIAVTGSGMRQPLNRVQFLMPEVPDALHPCDDAVCRLLQLKADGIEVGALEQSAQPQPAVEVVGLVGAVQPADSTRHPIGTLVDGVIVIEVDIGHIQACESGEEIGPGGHALLRARDVHQHLGAPGRIGVDFRQDLGAQQRERPKGVVGGADAGDLGRCRGGVVVRAEQPVPWKALLVPERVDDLHKQLGARSTATALITGITPVVKQEDPLRAIDDNALQQRLQRVAEHQHKQFQRRPY